jgi:hypothetical protein
MQGFSYLAEWAGFHNLRFHEKAMPHWGAAPLFLPSRKSSLALSSNGRTSKV